MRIIRVVRSLFRVGQAELAGAAGVSVRELARIENGEVYASREILQSVDKALMTFMSDYMNVAIRDGAVVTPEVLDG